MNDNCICAHLYGDGSRNCKLRAEYIRCNRAGECSAYKNGKCFCVTTLFGVRCPNGDITIVDGGTKQSKKFLLVQEEARTNPAYGKLQYPSTNLITRIGEDAFLTVSYTWLEDFGGEIRCDNPHLGTNKLYISAVTNQRVILGIGESKDLLLLCANHRSPTLLPFRAGLRSERLP
jgi:hypothetical protein